MRTQKEIEDKLYSIRCKIYKTGGNSVLIAQRDLLEWILSNKIEDIIKSDLEISEKTKKINDMFMNIEYLQRKIERLEERINKTENELDEQTQYIIEQLETEKE